MSLKFSNATDAIMRYHQVSRLVSWRMADILGLVVRVALATAVDSAISFRKEKITFQRGPNQEFLCLLPRKTP